MSCPGPWRHQWLHNLARDPLSLQQSSNPGMRSPSFALRCPCCTRHDFADSSLPAEKMIFLSNSSSRTLHTTLTL